MRSTGKRKNKRARLLLGLALLAFALAACGGEASTGTASPSSAPAGQLAQHPETAAPAATATHPLPSQTSSPQPTQTPLSAPSAAPAETALGPTALSVGSLPSPAGFTWAPVAAGLESPVGMAQAGDGSGRLFILEQPGRIRVIQGGELLPEPFLDLRDRVGSAGSEQGLLGLAFHPRYLETGQFFVNYTDLNGDTVISRFQVSPQHPNRADPGGEARLLFVDQPFANHNGGMLAFGPDGYLYIGLGDGGSGGDPQGNGQNTNTLLGKILRIDVDGGDPYGIPPDNPFAGGGGRAEIWALGLRNPWRFSFDRQTGDLYIGDVGQGTWEEVDVQPAASAGGENYGWKIMEGQVCFNETGCDISGLTLPVFVYATHAEGTCAVTGGVVYRGSLPAFAGVYLLGDYCSGRVWGLVQAPGGAWQSAALFETGARITSFGEDEAGEIYLISHSGEIYRLEGKP